MQKNSLFLALSTSLSFLSLLALGKPTLAQFAPTPEDNFTMPDQYQCLLVNGIPTTVVDTPRGTIPLIVWRSNFFSRSGWTPERRCQEVSKRFQQHSSANTLRYISSGMLNGYKIICVADEKISAYQTVEYECKKNGILITLEHKDNPEQVMQEMFNLSARINNGPITRGAKRQQFAIDLKDFLEKAPPLQDSNSGGESYPENLSNGDNNMPVTNTNNMESTTNSTPAENMPRRRGKGISVCELSPVLCSDPK